MCVPGRSLIPSHLIAYSAQKFSALPHTSVYIEAGAADWPAAGAQGGVDAALGSCPRGATSTHVAVASTRTHYSSTNNEVARGAAIVRALAARGIRGKHVVINTSSSGHPFVFGKYTGPDPDNAWVCRICHRHPDLREAGHPATTDVAKRRVAPDRNRRTALARTYVGWVPVVRAPRGCTGRPPPST